MRIPSWLRRDNGHETDAELSAFIDGELAPDLARSLESHVASCDDCASRLDSLRQAKSVVASLPRASAPRSFALSPSLAGETARPQPLRRQGLVFVPAIALTVLVALVAVDLSSGGSSLDSGGFSTALSRSAADDSALSEQTEPPSIESSDAGATGGAGNPESAPEPEATSALAEYAKSDEDEDSSGWSPSALTVLELFVGLVLVGSTALLTRQWLTQKKG